MDAYPLDKTDRKIMHYLTENGRLSYSVLASNVGLSRDSVKARIENMMRARAILSFRAQTTHPYFGLEFYNVYISFRKLDSERQANYESYIRSHNAVMWSNKCIGKWDYALLLLVKNPTDLSEILADFKEKFSIDIKDIEFDIVLYEYVYTARVAAFFADLGTQKLKVERDDSAFYKMLERQPVILGKKREEVSLDTTDVKILEILSENCRTTIQEISAKTGIPAENIRYRMRTMIERKIIVAFWAAVNYDMFGLHWYRIRARTNRADEKTEKKLGAFLRGHPNVFWAARSVGRADLHIDVRAENNNRVGNFLREFDTMFESLVTEYEILVMTNDHDYRNFTTKVYEMATDYVQK